MRMRRILSRLAALALCAALLQAPPARAAGSSEVTMRVGDRRTINAPIQNMAVSNGSWSSNNPQAVRIVSSSSFTCEVEALATTGNSFVNLNYRYLYKNPSTGLSSYRNMDVRVRVEPALPTGISLSASYMTVTVGKGQFLSASVTPEGADYGSYLYFSEDTSVATVESDGFVYGVAPGTTRVRVKTQLQGLTAYCEVTVVPQMCRISFNANGGAVSPSSATAAVGGTYGTLPVPERAGYAFEGWFTAAEGGTEVTASSVVKQAGEQTLYAHWTEEAVVPQVCRISFDGNGGSVSPSAVTVTVGEPYGTLPVPERAGYAFEGWFTAAEGGTEVTASSVVKQAGEQTLYAHWAEEGAALVSVLGWTSGESSAVILSDPDGVLKNCGMVYAVLLDGGKMKNLLPGELIGTTVMVDGKLEAGWTLFYLSKSAAPVCGKTELS